MKKFIIASVLALVASVTLNAQQLGTPVSLSTNIGGTFNLLSQGARIKYIQISGSSGLVTFYDSASAAALSTNGGVVFVNGTSTIVPAYNSVTNFITNTVATNYIGTTGYTNYYTNAGMWTLTNTIPLSTNTIKTAVSFAVSANIAGGFPVDLVFNRGITMVATTNANVVVYYLPL